MKVVPSPGVDSTQMTPPLWLTMPYTVASPRPVPSPTALVVKNGSKTARPGRGVHADAGVANDEHHVRPGLEIGVRPLVALAELDGAVRMTSCRRPASRRGR